MKRPITTLITGMGIILATCTTIWLLQGHGEPSDNLAAYCFGESALGAVFMAWWFNKIIKQYPLNSDGANPSLYNNIKSFFRPIIKLEIFPYLVTVVIALVIFLTLLFWIDLLTAVIGTLIVAILWMVGVVILIIYRAMKGDPTVVKR